MCISGELFHLHLDSILAALTNERKKIVDSILQSPDEQPEFPIVTRKYFVEFLFLADQSPNADIYQLLHGEDGVSTARTEGTPPVQVRDFITRV